VYKRQVHLRAEVEVDDRAKKQLKAARKPVQFIPENVDAGKPEGVVLKFCCENEHDPTKQLVGEPLLAKTSNQKEHPHNQAEEVAKLQWSSI